MEVVVHPATIDDAPGIAAGHVLVWQHVYRGIVPDSFLDGLSVERRAEQWTESLSHLGPKDFVWVAEVGGNIVGFCWVGPSRDDDANEEMGELYAIYVLSTSQRSGIGSALAKRGVQSLAEVGFCHATLWVLARNEAAQQFYERLGRQRDGSAKTDNWQGVSFDEVRYGIDVCQFAVHS